MNLYDFSQINNNEMGVLISRKEEEQLYRDTSYRHEFAFLECLKVQRE